MNVKYFDVPGFGILDPAEYGNYLTGFTTAVIEFLTGSKAPYVLMVWAGRTYSYLTFEDSAVSESAHDELSAPFYNRGYTDGMTFMALSADNESMWGPRQYPDGYRGALRFKETSNNKKKGR
jgi:hypothetical protein